MSPIPPFASVPVAAVDWVYPSCGVGAAPLARRSEAQVARSAPAPLDYSPPKWSGAESAPVVRHFWRFHCEVAHPSRDHLSRPLGLIHEDALALLPLDRMVVGRHLDRAVLPPHGQDELGLLLAA